MGAPGYLEAYARAAGVAMSDVVDRVLCAVDQVRDHLDVIRVGTTGQARTLAFQFGSPPNLGGGIEPRSMAELPYIVDEHATEDRTTIDVKAGTGRYGSAGYVANIGDDEFRAAWIGINGTVSGQFSMPPGTTEQVPCLIKGVLIMRASGTDARYRVSIS